jgi:hypothetical protein
MSFSSLVQQRLLPIESVSLGRLVSDVSSPQRRFHDPLLRNLQSSKAIQQDFQEFCIREKSSAVSAQLTELLKTFRGKANLEGTQVQATASATYELQQWETLFKEACALESTRKWIVEAIEDDCPVYYIVGFRTFLNPSAFELLTIGDSKGVELSLPASTVVQAYVPGLLLDGVLDPAVGPSKGLTSRNGRSYHAEGEMIYAIQYCKVQFKWYSSRSVHKSTLGKTKWKIHWGVRGADDDGEDDILEAELVPETANEN